MIMSEAAQEMLEITLRRLLLTREVESRTRETIASTEEAFGTYARMLERALANRELFRTKVTVTPEAHPVRAQARNLSQMQSPNQTTPRLAKTRRVSIDSGTPASGDANPGKSNLDKSESPKQTKSNATSLIATSTKRERQSRPQLQPRSRPTPSHNQEKSGSSWAPNFRAPSTPAAPPLHGRARVQTYRSSIASRQSLTQVTRPPRSQQQHSRQPSQSRQSIQSHQSRQPQQTRQPQRTSQPRQSMLNHPQRSASSRHRQTLNAVSEVDSESAGHT